MFFMTRRVKIAVEKLTQLKRKCSIVSSASQHAHMGESQNLKRCWWPFRKEWPVSTWLCSRDRWTRPTDAAVSTVGKNKQVVDPVAYLVHSLFQISKQTALIILFTDCFVGSKCKVLFRSTVFDRGATIRQHSLAILRPSDKLGLFKLIIDMSSFRTARAPRLSSWNPYNLSLGCKKEKYEGDLATNSNLQ